jgi:hypothetical protein
MNKFRIFPGTLAVILATIADTPDALAGDINGPAMAGLVLNNTIPDGDLYGLGLFAGRSMDVLNTNATDTTTGFTETLSGTYAGQALSVTYTGNSLAFPGGAVTWTSSGSYGVQGWTGNGSATFTFPTTSTFQVAYSSIVTIGSNTVQYNSVISGADNGTWLYYTGTTGTLTLNSMPIPEPEFTEYILKAPSGGKLVIDDIDDDGEIIIWSQYEIKSVYPSPPSPPITIVAAGTIQFVPEPSSMVLAGFGVLSLIVGYACRRPGKTRTLKPEPYLDRAQITREGTRPSRVCRSVVGH